MNSTTPGDSEKKNAVVARYSHVVVVATYKVGIAHAKEVFFEVFVRLRCIFYVNVSDVALAALLIEEENIDILAVVYRWDH